MYRVIIAIFLVAGLSTSVMANDEAERLWKSYNDAILGEDCQTALNRLDDLIKIDPNLAYPQKAFLYERGKCLPLDIDKAIQNYRHVSIDDMDKMFVVNLKHLLFLKAQSPAERQEVLSGMRQIFFDLILFVNNAKGLEAYLQALYPNSKQFLSALRPEIDYFHSLDANPDLKLSLVEKWLEQEKFEELSTYWIYELASQDNPKANFLFAKYFDGFLKEYSGALRSAAQSELPEAQIAMGKIYEKEGTQPGYRFAYFWYLKAAKNGVDVSVAIEQVKAKLSAEDIAHVEDGILNKNSIYH